MPREDWRSEEVLREDDLREDDLREDDLLGSLIQEALIQEALIQGGPSQERLEQGLLAEVCAAEAESASRKLSAAVRTIALHAFETEHALIGQVAIGQVAIGRVASGQGPEPVPGRDVGVGSIPLIPSGRILRARRLRPLLSTRTWLSAAAMLLLTLAAGIFLSGSEPVAEAGIQLNALKRLDRAGAAGMSQVESRYFAPLGRLFTPAEDEWLSFAFAPEALLVVGAGDAVRVTRSKLAGEISVPWLGTGRGEEAGHTTLLRLESGEARLATRGGAIAVEVAAAGVFVLLEGAAHIAVALEDASGMPVVALAEGSEARFHRPDGSSIPLAGPSRVLLAPKGPRAFGTVAHSLFRELAFFGGPLPEPTQERRVSARLWRARCLSVPQVIARALPGAAASKKGEAAPSSGSWIRRRRADIQLLTPRADTAAAVSLRWRPQRILSDAHLLRVALRAPVGTTVSLAHAGLAGATLSTAVEVTTAYRESTNRAASSHKKGSQATPEPGIATLELPLPRGWYERLADGELELVIEVPATGPRSKGPRSTGQGSTGPAVPAGTNAPAGAVQSTEIRRRSGVVRAWFDGVSLVLGPSEHGLPRAPHEEKSSGSPPKRERQD